MRGTILLLSLTLLTPTIGAPVALAGTRGSPPAAAGDQGRALLRPADALTGHSPIEATRLLIEQQWGRELPVGRPSFADNEDDYEITRLGLPASDMTGDALPDVLSYEVREPKDVFSTDYTYSLYGLRGTDGVSLWERHFGERFDLLPLATPDLSGDGLGDVLVLTYEKDAVQAGNCGSTLCVLVDEDQHHWSLEVLSGANGSTLWRWQLDGAHGGAGLSMSNIPPSTLTSDFARETTGAAVVPILSGDHDGDGLPDLIVNDYDTVQTGTTKSVPNAGSRVFANGYQELIETHARVVTGDSGTELLVRTQDLTLGGGMLTPAGRTVGSATPDLLWQVETVRRPPTAWIQTPAGDEWVREAANTLDLEMIDGATLQTAWEAPMARDHMDWGFAESSQADLDGDGHDDLLAFQRVIVEDNETAWTMVMVSGAGGALIWQRPIQDYPDPLDRIVIGPVGGGAGRELLFVDLVLHAETQEFDVVAQRIDGASGHDLLVTRWTTSAQEGFGIEPAGDLDGDDVVDLLFLHVDRFQEQPEGPFHSRSTIWVESGATGQELSTFTREGDASPLSFGDVDGDSRPEVILGWVEAGMQVVRLEAVALASGTPLWSATTAPAAFDLRVAAALDGERGDDLFLSRTVHTSQDHRSRVEVLDGSKGSTRWARGEPIPFAEA